MADPEIVEEHFVNQYSRNVIYLAQQKGSRLRGTVRRETINGEEMFWDTWGKSDPMERTVRFGDSPVSVTPRGSRRMVPEAWERGEFVDSFDRVKVLNDPTNPIVNLMGMGFGRTIDRIILRALGGTAQEGRSSITNVALPSSQKVLKDDHLFGTGSGDANLTISKLIQARNILGMADVTSSTYYLVHTRDQVSSLLSTTEATSIDFNTVKALVNGEIDTFMGFKFIEVSPTLVPKVGTSRFAYAYTPDAVVLGERGGLQSNIDRRADKSFNWYVYSCMFAAATRLEEEKVVEIECTEA